MLQDLMFALRLFNRHRGYAATAILTVALGVGANVAIFSVADSALFRPLPFADAGRLFFLRIGNPKTGEVYGMLPGSAVDAARATGLFDGMAVSSTRASRAYVRRSGGLDVLSLSPVSRGYLELLGIQPIAGRGFTVEDDGTRAVLLSQRAWLRRYGGDPAIVDASIPGILRSLDGSKPQDRPCTWSGYYRRRYARLSSQEKTASSWTTRRDSEVPVPPTRHWSGCNLA